MLSTELWDSVTYYSVPVVGTKQIIVSCQQNLNFVLMNCLNFEFLLHGVQVDLVKFSAVPIEQSLLRLEPGELSELAVECFAAIMRYMGDLPMAPDSTEVKCVYTILMVRINCCVAL